ncbi:release factor glutamine methyltransferase [Sanguibacter gelidistatuariae]|uniref:peptide chain release factor N(5)-glutamine methyltransferase n=1 Tax=Sanguibacter gelidistatuariae TaxID=1814289 RepID=A0A1G6VP12_9MICO|nr:release factor glutamine methyltransferase [Sanguibacter gelidistatuariae]
MTPDAMSPDEQSNRADAGPNASPARAAAPQDAARLLRSAAARLADAGVDSPRVDAELLLAHVCGLSRADLTHRLLLGRPVLGVAALGDAAPGATALEESAASAEDRFLNLVTRRAAREPLQHLTGTAPFRHTELAVGPGVFVPRPETEAVAQVAIDEARRVAAERGSVLVVDLCTGSGAIAIAVHTEVEAARVHAVELDAEAFVWAQRNVAAYPSTSGTLVDLVRGDARRAFAELDGTCDVVVSNPPYVPTGAVPKDPEVARHDPAVALYGLGPDGLEVPRGVTRSAARLLAPGGLYVMEHAEVQDAAARAMVAETGLFDPATTHVDLTGRPRMVVARRNRSPIMEDSHP